MGIRIEPIGNEQSITRLQRYIRRQRFAAKTFETMETAETKYAHVFVSGEDQYLFVRLLAVASESNAQLVVNARTGELLVRKVGNRLLNEREREKEDPERILFLLQSQARLRGVQSNLAHLLAAEDVPAPQESDGGLLFHRVKCFKFYNGGNLGDLYDACITRSIGIPPSLILTMTVEMVHALDFISSMDPYVLHGDAHMNNILLHWDNNVLKFFLGDWGWSTCGRLRAGNKEGLPVDIVKIWLHVGSLLDAGANSSLQPVLRQYLTEIIEPELRKLSYGPPSRLPDLAPLLRLLSAAPDTTPPDMRPFMLNREPQSPPSPLLHDTLKEAQEAEGIRGPWHVGQVSIDPSSGKLTVVRLSPSVPQKKEQCCPDRGSKSDRGSEDWSDVSSIKSEDWTIITGP